MKRVLRVLSRIFRVALLVFTVAVVLFTIATAAGLNRESGLFGYKMYIVLSDSMSDRFRAGDLANSRTVDPETLAEGDIITFKSIDPVNYGAVVTHMIKAETIYNGQPAFITRGTANDFDDAVPALPENILGRYAFHVPKAGYVFDTLRTPTGYFLLILLPFLLILAFEGSHFVRLFKQYKRELKEETDAGERALEDEKKKSEEMARELVKLRQALDARESGSVEEPSNTGAAEEAESDRLAEEPTAEAESDRLAEESTVKAESDRLAEESTVKAESDSLAEEPTAEADGTTAEEQRASAGAVGSEEPAALVGAGKS